MQPSVSPPTGPLPVPETAEDALMSLMMALGRRLRQKQPGDVIDYSAFPILKLLLHQGPMRLSALAQALRLDASTVSRHARQLEDRGLLERTDDPDDGRASRVEVSEAGRASLEQAFEARHHVITAALEGMTEAERETLRDLLHRVVETLTDQHDRHEAGGTPTGTPTSSQETHR
jgi:DNA-binding MarR family transcriptional regulator